MKKLMMGLIAFVMCFSSFAQEIQPLNENNDFINYVTKSSELIKKVSESLNFEKEKIKSALVTIEELKKNKELNESEAISKVTQILNLTDENIFIEYIQMSKNTIQKLRDSYGTKLDDVNYVSDEILKVLKISPDTEQPIIFSTPTTTEASCAHPWRMGLCAGAVMAEAQIMLAGCSAVTAGAGLVFFGAAILIWQTNGIAECNDKWCLNKLKNKLNEKLQTNFWNSACFSNNIIC